MAKQCIYCGRPLAKDDARFCNDCGQPQFAPANVGASAPSAIKVRLPPKEYLRDDVASDQPETHAPRSSIHATPVSSPAREPAAPPSARLPKRPPRLAAPVSTSTVDKAQPVVEPEATVVRQADEAESASRPTPAEEISTMVLPNWREELAKLRKEQEQAAAEATVAKEKKPTRTTAEPPPLPRRSPSASPTPPPIENDGTQVPERPSSHPTALKPFTQIPETPQPRDSVQTPEVVHKTSSTPLSPQEGRRSVDSGTSIPDTPQVSFEGTRAPDAGRRELHVKVWEQETIARPASPQEKRLEEGPAPAVEQSPFASADFGAGGQIDEDEQLASVTWQMPPDSRAAKQKQKISKEAASPASEQESLSSEEEKRPVAKEGKQPPLQKEIRHPTDDGRAQPGIEEDQQDIEDLPTVRLAVPEQEASIKIERSSTPAPKKWSAPRSEDVEDLPTRPMPASPGGSGAPRPVQQGPLLPNVDGSGGPGAARPMQPGPVSSAQGIGPRSEPGSIQPGSPSPQRNIPSLPTSGQFDAPPAMQAGGRSAEMEVDPFVARSRPASPPGAPGSKFDPASLPPLPPGPLPAPGNNSARSELQGPAGAPPALANNNRPRPDLSNSTGTPQRPSALETGVASASASANVQKSDQAGADQAKKPRKKKRTGLWIVIILLLVVLIGAGAGAFVERDWVIQFFQSPAQNQPYQTYQNSALGVSLEYTQQWNVNFDQAHSTVHFADSSHTGQVNLTVTTTSAQVGAYLTQQANQLGIAGAKAAPSATIGGANWQGLQGTVTQSGATYIAKLYVTQHNGHMYLLEFLAPQANFTAIDNSNFNHMRSSFTFI